MKLLLTLGFIVLCIFAAIGFLVLCFLVISAFKKDEKPTFPKPETWDKTLE
jgi:hypothetical protein